MFGFHHIDPYFALAILLCIGLLVIVPLVALTEIVSSDFRPSILKLVWVLIVVFLNIPGTALYWFVGRDQRIA